MTFESTPDNAPIPEKAEQKLAPVLLNVEEVETGKPASFIAYHGTDKLFIKAEPDDKHPLVFYADTPETAATYPWAYHRYEASKEFERAVAEDPEAFLAARLLFTKSHDDLPAMHKRLIPDYSRILYIDEAHPDPELLAVKEKLISDASLQKRAGRINYLWDSVLEIDRAESADVTTYERGPLGRVKEYAITSKNPFVFDYGGKTWGTQFPDPDDLKGGWLFPIRSATRAPTTADIRIYWDKWLTGLFEKGHDAVIIRNIRDVGTNHDGVMPLHTTIAVDQKAEVEMNTREQLADTSEVVD